MNPVRVLACPACLAVASLLNGFRCALTRCPRQFVEVTKPEAGTLAYYAMTPKERQERNEEQNLRRRSRYRERVRA